MSKDERPTDVLIREAIKRLLESRAEISYASLIHMLRTQRRDTTDSQKRVHYTLAVGEVRAHQILHQSSYA